MSTDHISAALRRLVAARADNLCEYCLIHEGDTFFGCEVDHIISLKHGGPTEENNLAFACLVCNRNKGSDIASLVPGTEDLTLPASAEDRFGEPLLSVILSAAKDLGGGKPGSSPPLRSLPPSRSFAPAQDDIAGQSERSEETVIL